MDTVELAYWAGFFDGEGHIELAYTSPTYANPRGRYAFQVWLDQWTETPDEFFAPLLDKFGGRVIPHKKNPNCYRWYISGENGRRFLESILPYLRKKKRVAELGIEYQSMMQKGRGGKRTRLEETDIRARDIILREYYRLTEVTQPKRKRKLGRHTFVARKLR